MRISYVHFERTTAANIVNILNLNASSEQRQKSAVDVLPIILELHSFSYMALTNS